MAIFYLVYNRTVFALKVAVYKIIVIPAYHRLVGRNLYDIKRINLAELRFLGKGGTCHTRELPVHAKIVLEGYCRLGFVFLFDLDTLFCLNRLMQTVGIASARHNSAGKSVYNNNLSVFYDIIDIKLHYASCSKSIVNIVHKLNVLRVAYICNTEMSLRFFDAVCSQNRAFCLFVNNIILDNILIRFFRIEFLYAITFKLANKTIRSAVHIAALLALSGNDKGSSRFVYKYAVYLVNYCESVPALNEMLFVNDHIVTQIIEPEFVIGSIGDVSSISLFTGCIVFFMGKQANRKPKEPVHFSHPFAVTAGKVVIYCDNMHAFAR